MFNRIWLCYPTPVTRDANWCSSQTNCRGIKIKYQNKRTKWACSDGVECRRACDNYGRHSRPSRQESQPQCITPYMPSQEKDEKRVNGKDLVPDEPDNRGYIERHVPKKTRPCRHLKSVSQRLRVIQ